jgi:histidine triad (HIT) family protein
MTTDPSCVFCRIVAGEVPASVVAEDEFVFAFMDVNPLTPGHLLVIPREHHAKIATIPSEVMSRMMTTAQRLAAALRASRVKTEGINLYLADGSAAGQEVLHSHIHVLPRWHGDGFRISVERKGRPTREELDERASVIRAAAE